MDERYYEEKLDLDLAKLLPQQQQIEKVEAFRVSSPRLIGDIGLRAFLQLRRKALELVRKEAIDFVYIPIPSFYAALIGPYLHRKTGVKYGIDYIDPWVHRFPGAEKTFSRHWWSMKLAGLLEPLAIKKASLITGVAEGYYQGVKERNPRLERTCLFGAMPYGGEPGDHDKVRELGLKPYLFEKKEGKLQLVYAGAMLPKAYKPLEQIFRAIRANKALFRDVEFHFIGTGRTPNDPQGYNIKPLAQRFGLWHSFVFEYPARIPYLDVLVHLEASSGTFILGSTEPHYTPSKVYQAVLSSRPVLAVLHEKSQAFGLLNRTGAGVTIGITEDNISSLQELVPKAFGKFKEFQESFSPGSVVKKEFEEFSAFKVTGKLVSLLNKLQ
ncbi:glycosyltransferase family 4 protein [Flavisolibacter nicotianae]|uniref:glycosyltransferase family 4 protein n=1 Tax=Flavisolibacter nicotianae TaxID=2364882 RepID=UPI0013C4119B|nr:glycosyltransferase family 4 protein [Flavisolibacter nicotianae]